MRIFISWSGEQSNRVANLLKGWLPLVIQSVEPWFSETEIESGSQWFGEISDALFENCMGIICLTPENLNKP